MNYANDRNVESYYKGAMGMKIKAGEWKSLSADTKQTILKMCTRKGR